MGKSSVEEVTDSGRRWQGITHRNEGKEGHGKYLWQGKRTRNTSDVIHKQIFRLAHHTTPVRAHLPRSTTFLDFRTFSVDRLCTELITNVFLFTFKTPTKR